MGVANMAGSFFRTYTSAGSFSRSAVVVSTGGSSQLAGIVTAAAVALTLKLFTPCFTRGGASNLAPALAHASAPSRLRRLSAGLRPALRSAARTPQTRRGRRTGEAAPQ